MGESVTEGSVVEWRKRVGDFVAEGDPLVEITTDKVNVEVPATVSGVVTKIGAREGETVAVGAVLAEIDTTKTEGQASPAFAKPASGNGAATAPRPAGPSAPIAPSRERARDWPTRRPAVWQSGSTSTSAR